MGTKDHNISGNHCFFPPLNDSVFQCTYQTQTTMSISLESYPRCEVDRCPSVQQERGHIDVAIVGSNMQGSEATLQDRQERDRHTERRTDVRHKYLLHVHDVCLLIFPACSSLIKHHRWTKKINWKQKKWRSHRKK